MDIIAGNKTIAEFMGLKPMYKKGCRLPYLTKEEVADIENHSRWVITEHWGTDMEFANEVEYLPEPHTLSYNEEWGDLMPVVEKIATIHYGWPSDKMDTKYDDCAYPRTFGMRDAEGNYMVRFNANGLITGKTLIEATWLAVLDFIQWHNSLDT